MVRTDLVAFPVLSDRLQKTARHQVMVSGNF